MKEITVKSNMKKAFLPLLPLYLGYLIYSVLNILYGSCGVGAMRNLEAYRDTLINNIAEIEENQEELELELSTLRNSVDKVAVEARDIGFFRENEGVIEIDGYRRQKNFYAVGRLLNPSEKPALKKPIFRTISFCVIIITCIFLLLQRRREHGRSSRKP